MKFAAATTITMLAALAACAEDDPKSTCTETKLPKAKGTKYKYIIQYTISSDYVESESVNDVCRRLKDKMNFKGKCRHLRWSCERKPVRGLYWYFDLPKGCKHRGVQEAWWEVTYNEWERLSCQPGRA
jgi:hypothetical protein